MKKPHKSQLLITKISLKARYEIVIFLFLLFEFALMIDESTIDLWVLTHYLITYEFGLIPRAFIGSVLSLFTNKITYHVVYVVAIIFFIILISQISLLLGSSIRRSESDVKPSVKIFTLLFLASPLSVTYLLGGYFARLDMYWIIITLIALVFLKNRILRWTIPLLSAIAIMIHQAYIVTYMPALVIPMLYEIYKSKYSKKSIAVFSLSCFSMIFIFLFLLFAQKNIPFVNAADFVKHISKNVGFTPDIHMIYAEYYCPISEWTIHVVLPILSYIALPVGLTLLVFSIPLIIIFGYIWKQSFKDTKNKFMKFVFLLCAAAPSVFVLAAFFGTDWDRWWAAVINNQFIIIFYFIVSKEKAVTDSVQKVGKFLKDHLLLFSLILIFSNSLTFSKATALVLNISHLDPEKFLKILNYLGGKTL